MAGLSHGSGQREVPLAKKSSQAAITSNEQHFDFLGLPLEIRDMVYDYIYIEDKTQLAQDESAISKATFPHLSCSMHLVCKTTKIDIDAFLKRRKRHIPITLCHSVHTIYDKSNALLQKRLRCPTAGNVHLSLFPGLDPSTRSEDVVRAVLGCVYEIRKAPVSVPKRELYVNLQYFITQPRLRRSNEIRVCIDAMALKISRIEGFLENVVRPRIEAALLNYQTALDDPECIYRAFCTLEHAAYLQCMDHVINVSDDESPQFTSDDRRPRLIAVKGIDPRPLMDWKAELRRLAS
ncbi:hypothetical protein N7G274_002005 [Stereocaulon virgatum]|uniref:Uncharacterized protein n=1 Tax=Stereocaulon virgatum TaxID=373712 RepID=A0ABR4AIH4_9LECA